MAAALAQEDGIFLASYHYLCVEPVNLFADKSAVYLQALMRDQLSQAEQQTLIDSLNQHLADEQLMIVLGVSQRWYLRLIEPDDITTHSIQAAQGKNILEVMPEGNEKAKWHRRFCEWQMLLQNHPVNVARRAKGEATVDALWCWDEQAPTFWHRLKKCIHKLWP